MTYLFAILAITGCSLAHDSDTLKKASCVIIHALLLLLAMGGYGWIDLAATAVSVGIFWGVFRRGWQAKAELTAIRLKTPEAIDAIINEYPFNLGHIPRLITIQVIKFPYESWQRRLQSALIAVLFTAPISAMPVLITLAGM